jgi:hypothetical protein
MPSKPVNATNITAAAPKNSVRHASPNTTPNPITTSPSITLDATIGGMPRLRADAGHFRPAKIFATPA